MTNFNIFAGKNNKKITKTQKKEKTIIIMNKNTIIKCSLFLSYLILIVAIICLWHQEPATPELNLFYNQENVLASLPDYPNRHINKQNWNKGVNVECGKNSSLSKNKFIIIEPCDSISIYGWAIDNDRNCPVSEIYMEINNKFIKGIYGLPRPDIKRELRIQGSSSIGFVFHFDRTLLKNENGEYCQSVKFHMIDKEEKMTISAVEYTLLYKKERPNLPIRKINSPHWEKGLVIERIYGATLDNNTKTITLGNEDIHIGGWYLDLDNNQQVKNMYIAVGNYFYNPTFISDRQDVANLFGLTSPENIGFDAIIPQYVLRDEKGKQFEYIEFFLEDQNGYICEPFKFNLK